MSLGPGTRIGAYEITGALGAGGMGDVYRALDNKLGRAVALKCLPDAFVSDPDRLMRFEREARTLASLNHPHIAHIYGFETAIPDGAASTVPIYALVMELVEGEDLTARIARGAMTYDEVKRLARQIADALTAAHERGVIHRDLKPANIKVRTDGTVKVLDFGLAKALDATPESQNTPRETQVRESHSMPVTSPAVTAAGIVLGTAAYMSPEQARGRPVDRRADIWAFGAVLFEMFTGKRAFGGEDVADTLASVLRAEPDWQLLPVNVPEGVRTLIRRCLDKDPENRPSHLSVATFLLTNTGDETQSSPALPSSPSSATSRGRLVFAATVALLVGGAIASSVMWWWLARANGTPQHAPVRFTLTADTGGETWRISTDRPFVLSPDGRAVVYRVRTRDNPQLVIRTVDKLEPRVLAEFETAPRAPFFSPDS